MKPLRWWQAWFDEQMPRIRSLTAGPTFFARTRLTYSGPKCVLNEASRCLNHTLISTGSSMMHCPMAGVRRLSISSGDGKNMHRLMTCCSRVRTGLVPSTRFGAIDFQESSDEYVARANNATLDDLHSAADRLEAGLELPIALQDALVHRTSIGGARPKATVTDSGTEYIAKFSSSTDSLPVIQAEAASMYLARRAGLRCAPVRIVESLRKIVLLVERFDRDGRGGRTHTASVLSLMKERAVDGHYLSYSEIVRKIQEYSSRPAEVGPEMFQRIAFNIAIGNTDDHARNHAVFWDGTHADLAPAYDLAPQPRSGMPARQAMSLGDGFGSTRESSFAALLGESSLYDLTRS